MAALDQLALHALYARSQRVVFTLIMRITGNRETAEELTLDVIHDAWRRAATKARAFDGSGLRSPTKARESQGQLDGTTLNRETGNWI